MRIVSFKPLTAALAAVVLAASLSTAALAGVPGSTSALNVDAKGTALGGYDPVAYFEPGKAQRGLETISESYGGARYLFATEAHRKEFLKNPAKYVPQFGGFCAVGAAHGKKADVDPETGKVVNGKLYLNNSLKVKALFDQDPTGNISRAEQNWPTLKDSAL